MKHNPEEAAEIAKDHWRVADGYIKEAMSAKAEEAECRRYFVHRRSAPNN
jgi:hypothetical protein